MYRRDKRNDRQRKRRAALSKTKITELKKKAQIRMSKNRESQSIQKKLQIKAEDKERRRLARLCKKTGASTTDEVGIDVHQSNFDCL